MEILTTSRLPGSSLVNLDILEPTSPPGTLWKHEEDQSERTTSNGAYQQTFWRIYALILHHLGSWTALRDTKKVKWEEFQAIMAYQEQFGE